MDIKPGAHVHLIGICGTAMASLAGLLKDRGFKVTGSDQNVYPPMSTQLENMDIKIMEGYRRENLSPKPDLVIVGNVITRKHEEAIALLESDIPYTSLPKAMGEFVIDHRHSIVVSGTHGKTTTTSMIAWVATELGLDPGFLIGGIAKNFGKSYQVPKGDWFVIEGDEYDTAFFDKVPKFVHYRPKSAILTSVEFDHADIYADLEAVKQAFLKLLALIPADGRLIACADDANIEELLRRQKVPRVRTFGLRGGDYQAFEVLIQTDRMVFKVKRQGQEWTTVRLRVFGDYNVLNALAALALADDLGWDLKKVLAALESFQGVKRRQEIIGEPNGITIIEDFAHHPTAVRETIKLVQTRYPKAHVYSVFEPRSATSRRKVFQKDYLEALGQAHSVLLPKPYNQSTLAETDRFSSDELIAGLQAKKVDAGLFENADAIVANLRGRAKPGDVILVMSNGGFDGIYAKLTSALTPTSNESRA